MKPQLLHISYSPWSERARWALQVRGIDHDARGYQPLLGEPELRWRLRQWTGPVSVPVLLTDDGALGDSFLIAKYAEQHGSGTALFPVGSDATIVACNVLSERGLAAGRALSLARVLTSPDALLEMVPPSLRSLPGALALASAGVKRTLAKYESPAQGNREALAEVLEQLRRDLANSPSKAQTPTLLENFSYADITMSQVLAFVQPPSTGLRIGRANRAAFHDAELSGQFADLVAWRDALYAAFRAPT